jgi:hypothetical protein
LVGDVLLEIVVRPLRRGLVQPDAIGSKEVVGGPMINWFFRLMLLHCLQGLLEQFHVLLKGAGPRDILKSLDHSAI